MPVVNAPGGRRHAGISLIEVMVSLVVVSLGALSATQMQMLSKRNNREATQRLWATHLAGTLVERMRANSSPLALRTYASIGRRTDAARRPIGGRTLYRQFNLDCAAAPASCCLDGYACSSDQVAAIELWQLEQVMDGDLEQFEGAGVSGLDTPTACITAPAPAGRDGFYTVAIAFRGTLAIPVDAAEPCGLDATDAGGNRLYGANDEYRRTLSVSAYIAPTVAK